MRGKGGALPDAFAELKIGTGSAKLFFWICPKMGHDAARSFEIERRRGIRRRELGFERGELAAVAEQEGEKFAGVPVAGDVALWLGDGAEEPAEVILVGPDGDADLIAAEEGDSCAEAVDGGALGEVSLEVEAEALLGAPADGYDDVLGAEAVNQGQEGWVGEAVNGV